MLPGETYVKGFLRTYAEYLGLDGQLYVDEYNSRFVAAMEEPVTALAPPQRPRQRRSESNFVVVALAGDRGRHRPGRRRVRLRRRSHPTRQSEGSTAPPRTCADGDSDGVEPAGDAKPSPKLARLLVGRPERDCWMVV